MPPSICKSSSQPNGIHHLLHSRRQGHCLVRRRVGELSRCKADTAVRDVKDVVETLQERHAINEVEAFAAQATKVVHDEVDGVSLPADSSVKLERFLKV